jgi:hypothetical protein
MEKLTLRSVRSALSVLAVLALSALVTSPAHATDVDGGETPEDVFSRAKAAADQNDTRAFFRLISPDVRAVMGFVMVAGARMAITMKASMEGGDPSEGAVELEAILKKHEVKRPPFGAPVDLDDEESVLAAARYMFAGVDVGALVRDLQALMAGLGFEGGGSDVAASGNVDGDLRDLRIEGDRATAWVGDEKGKFVRVNGRWYLEPDDDH